jgi:4-aminobutyrate aminotransferase-like enzyme
LTRPSAAQTHSPPSTIQAILKDLAISKAENDLVVATDGRKYIDLMTGCGTVFLGHNNPAITTPVQKQLEEIWNTGALATPIRVRASELVDAFVPPQHRLAALYSTGMEAAEFAMRIARIATGRNGVLGFDGCMHGKSTATAYLGWENERVRLPDFHRLPYVSTHSEEAILDMLLRTLSDGSIAAVFLEPLQASSGGHLASPAFYKNIAGLCARYGTLLVVDEILTGFYRTGEPFLFRKLDIHPDVILIGKAMGNGFPVSGVVVDKRYTVQPAMLPGSTYAGNPLAAAAVAATLSEMRLLDMRSRVAHIDETIRSNLMPLQEMGFPVRGQGALWIIEVRPEDMNQVVAGIFQRGVLVAPTGSYVRLLPPATIPPEHLIEACCLVREAVATKF